MTAQEKLKPGDPVRLKGKRQMTYVARLMDDISGGVELASPLGGFHCWNVTDLELVPDKELG